MADTISLGFIHGDDVTYPVTITGPASGFVHTPIDLTGATIKSDIRKEYGTSVLASFTINLTDLSNGKFELYLDAATSATLPQNSKGRVNSFVFDVEVTFASGNKDTIISGYLKVTNEVTV